MQDLIPLQNNVELGHKRSSPSQIVYNINFHWQFLITYSGFWLVNILLRKFDALSKKEMKMIKTQVFDGKQQQQQQKCQGKYICKYK